MIRRIFIDNFKSLVNFDLELKELNLLLGPNGVGKTSVFDVIHALRQLLSGRCKVTDDGIFPSSTLTRWQFNSIQIIEIDVVLDDFECRYRLEVDHEPSSRKARILLESLKLKSGAPLFIFHRGEVTLYRDDLSQGPTFGADWSESALARVPPRKDNTSLTRFLEYFRKIIVCGLYPAGFETESVTEDSVLDRNAANFAAWYRHLLLERQDLVSDFLRSIQEVISGVKGIRLERIGLDTRALMVSFDQFDKKFELRLDEISDGQRALIALYSLVHLAAGQGYSLFLDEPENYVALSEIQPWLMQLSDACGETVPQAVLCSHHPELIDYLGGDCGIVLERERSGVTRTKKIAEVSNTNALKLSELFARGWHE